MQTENALIVLIVYGPNDEYGFASLVLENAN